MASYNDRYPKSVREFDQDFVSKMLKGQQIKCITDINAKFYTHISTSGVKADLTSRLMEFCYSTLDSNNPSKISALQSIIRNSSSSSTRLAPRSKFPTGYSPDSAPRYSRPHNGSSQPPLMANFRPEHPTTLTSNSHGSAFNGSKPSYPRPPFSDSRSMKQISFTTKYPPSSFAPQTTKNVENDIMSPRFPVVKFLRFKESLFYSLVLPLSPHVTFRSPHGQSQATIELNLSDSNIEFLSSKRQDGKIPGLKLFSAPVAEFQKCLDPTSERGLVKFPDSCELHINNNQILSSIRGKKNKPGSTRPPDLHPHIKLTRETNRIALLFLKAPETYFLVTQLVLINPIPELVESIKKKATVPKEQVIETLFKNEDDGDLVATFELSLRCPVAFIRITEPFRSSHCQHAQCFDGNIFLQMNEQIETWACPVCQASIDPFKDLIRDGYFLDILQNTSDETDSVLIDSDGTWTVKKTEPEPEKPKLTKPHPTLPESADDDVIELSDGPDDSDSEASAMEEPADDQPDIIDLTETDDELDGLSTAQPITLNVTNFSANELTSVAVGAANANLPSLIPNQIQNQNQIHRSSITTNPTFSFIDSFSQGAWSEPWAPGAFPTEIPRQPAPYPPPSYPAAQPQPFPDPCYPNLHYHSTPAAPPGGPPNPHALLTNSEFHANYGSQPHPSDRPHHYNPAMNTETAHQTAYYGIPSSPRHYLTQPDPSP